MYTDVKLARSGIAGYEYRQVLQDSIRCVILCLCHFSYHMLCFSEELHPNFGFIARAKWSWWRHQMETFSALLAFCAGNSPVTGEIPALRPVTQSFDVFCDLRLNKRLSKQSWGWWFEIPLRSLWRHSNVSCLDFTSTPIMIIQSIQRWGGELKVLNGVAVSELDILAWNGEHNSVTTLD